MGIGINSGIVQALITVTGTRKMSYHFKINSFNTPLNSEIIIVGFTCRFPF